MTDLKTIQRQKRITPIGRFVFGALIEPRINVYGKGEWTAGFILSEEESQPLCEAIEEALAAKRAEAPKFPTTNEKIKLPFRPSEKKDENGNKVVVEGELLWNFVRRLEKKGREGDMVRNTPPNIYDSLGNLINGKINRIGGGTMGKVVYELYVYDQPGVQGVSLQLVGFQISELAPDADAKLDPIEGGNFVLEDEEQEIGALLSGNA